MGIEKKGKRTARGTSVSRKLVIKVGISMRILYIGIGGCPILVEGHCYDHLGAGAVRQHNDDH